MAMEPTEPFPIFKLANRYLLYDVEIVSYARRVHHITGVLVGGLPQASQQNVFLGLPLELMPEEVLFLTEKHAAYIVDDFTAHKRTFLNGDLSTEDRRKYQLLLRKQGMSAARDASKRSLDRKKAALQRKAGTDNWNDIPEEMLLPTNTSTDKPQGDSPRTEETATYESSKDDDLFAPAVTSVTGALTSQPRLAADAPDLDVWAVTPTTSHPPLCSQPREIGNAPETPGSYSLFKHLHARGYFISPGLRFGCQYMAYPGDPLRYHSHFLCRGLDWDEEFDLLDLVGGGRLGTAVKKAFLIGGQQKEQENDKRDTVHSNNNSSQKALSKAGATAHGVRTFCIEWGGM